MQQSAAIAANCSNAASEANCSKFAARLLVFPGLIIICWSCFQGGVWIGLKDNLKCLINEDVDETVYYKYDKHMFTVDACDRSLRIIKEFNGCYFHAHYENCFINKKATSETMHPFGKTYKVINDEFLQKIEQLMQNHPEISKATIEWECNFKRKMNCSKMKFFLDHYYMPHCLQRLKPRDTVRGALSDVYALKWKKTAGEIFFVPM